MRTAKPRGARAQPLVLRLLSRLRLAHSLAARALDLAAVRHVCPNVSDWPSITDTVVLSPQGDVTVCGLSVAAWQAAVPGCLRNVTTGPLPATLSSADIVAMARATLAG